MATNLDDKHINYGHSKSISESLYLHKVPRGQGQVRLSTRGLSAIRRLRTSADRNYVAPSVRSCVSLAKTASSRHITAHAT